MTLDEIIADYIRSRRDDALRERLYFAQQPDITSVIKDGALGMFLKGTKHRHQQRIPPGVLHLAQARLLKATKVLDNATDFATLLGSVELAIRHIEGIGLLATYDAAYRIGAFYGHEPELVYLHAGTARGAAKLGFKGATIHPSRLPKAFAVLTPAEIEDCLCIYKDCLPGAHSRSVRQPVSSPACASRGGLHRNGRFC